MSLQPSHEQTIGSSILSMPTRDPKAIAVKFKTGDQWTEKSWQNYFHDIEAIGAALLFFEINPHDRVAIISNSRYEWCVADLANFGVKAITVPIYQNNTSEDVEFILNNSAAKFLICENKATLKIWEEIKTRCPSVQKVFIFDPKASADHETSPEVDEKIISWTELTALGRQHLQDHPNCYRDLCATILPTDTATILYTSGTTGRPKGVVLTHNQIFSEISEAFPLCGVTPQDCSLSFLPYAHILGRIEHWGHTYIGFTLAFAESIERIRSNLVDIKPTIMVSVPRIFEKIYSAIWSQMDTQPLKMKLFIWALDVGQKVGNLKLSRQTISLDLLLQYEAAKKLVLNKISDAFGGRLRFAISGGAPISKDIALFFHSANILILEGYGMTESTAAITVNTPFNYKFGTVGRPIGDVQLKIAEDGEILVKSKKIMKEYWQDPQGTAAIFKDGWFCTGDIGEITDGGDLRITDRKKDLIKTAGGKYVAPQKLEGLLKLQPLLSYVLIHGDQKKYIVALLTLERTLLEKIALKKEIPFTDWRELVINPVIVDMARKAIAETNSHLASYEAIKKFSILPTEFSVEGGELTASLKVKRKLLDQKYREQIEALY